MCCSRALWLTKWPNATGVAALGLVTSLPASWKPRVTETSANWYRGQRHNVRPLVGSVYAEWAEGGKRDHDWRAVSSFTEGDHRFSSRTKGRRALKVSIRNHILKRKKTTETKQTKRRKKNTNEKLELCSVQFNYHFHSCVCVSVWESLTAELHRRFFLHAAESTSDRSDRTIGQSVISSALLFVFVNFPWASWKGFLGRLSDQFSVRERPGRTSYNVICWGKFLQFCFTFRLSLIQCRWFVVTLLLQLLFGWIR